MMFYLFHLALSCSASNDHKLSRQRDLQYSYGQKTVRSSMAFAWSWFTCVPTWSLVGGEACWWMPGYRASTYESKSASTWMGLPSCRLNTCRRSHTDWFKLVWDEVEGRGFDVLVVSFFRKEDQRVCSNYWLSSVIGTHPLSGIRIPLEDL